MLTTNLSADVVRLSMLSVVLQRKDTRSAIRFGDLVDIFRALLARGMPIESDDETPIEILRCLLIWIRKQFFSRHFRTVTCLEITVDMREKCEHKSLYLNGTWAVSTY